MNQTRFCPECGKELPLAARVCGYCGTRLGTLPGESGPVAPVVASPPDAGRRRSRWPVIVAVVVVVIGTTAGGIYLLSGADVSSSPTSLAGGSTEAAPSTTTATTLATTTIAVTPTTTTTTIDPLAGLPDPIAAGISGGSIRSEQGPVVLGMVLFSPHPTGTDTEDGLRIEAGGSLSFNEGVRPGTALVFRVAYEDDAGFHAVLDAGDFGQEGYRRFGLRIEPGDVLIDEWWEDDTTLAFDPVDTTVRTEANEFFHLLLGVDSDGVFRFDVVTPGLVTAIRSDAEFGANWERDAWNLYLAADRAAFTVSEVWIVNFDQFLG